MWIIWHYHLQKLNMNKNLTLIFSSIILESFQFTLFIILYNEINRDLIPGLNTIWQEFFAITVFLLAGFCRPLGGIIFSGIGDSKKRNQIFYISTITMSITAITLGLLPGAQTLGIVSPILLILLRIVQGLIIGALVPIAMIYCYEKSTPFKRVFTTSLLNIVIGIGYLLAIIFTTIAYPEFQDKVWRIGLLICGLVGAILAYNVRHIFHDELEFRCWANYSSFFYVIKNYKLKSLRLMCFATFLTSGLAVFFYVMPDFLHQYYRYSREQINLSTLCVIGSFMIGLALSTLAHRNLGKSFYVSSGFLFKALLVFVFHAYIKHNLIEITILNSICTFIFGFFMGKLPVMIVSTFKHEVRYAGVSLVYNISFGIMFGISHFLIIWLVNFTKSLYAPSMYIIFFSYISLISLWFMSKECFFNYETID